MATITSISITANDVASVVNTTAKSPIDIANNIKSYHSSQGDTLDTAQMTISALGTLETFAAAISKYKTSVPGLSLTLTSLGLNVAKAKQELKPKSEGGLDGIQNSTLNSIFADMSSLLITTGAQVKNPYLIGAGLIGALGFSVASLLSTPNDTSLADGVIDFFSKISDLPDISQLTHSDREGLAYQIANGDLSGVLYGAYNPSNSLVINYDPLILDLNGDGVKTTSI